jgi:metallophosphoesterase (TIGR03767 family)
MAGRPKRFAGTAGAISVLALSLLLAGAALAAPKTTLEKTIQDLDGDNLLEYAPGEDYTVIGAPQSFRPPRRGSIINFLQLSDFQTVDEESPARVEFLDFTQRLGSPLNPFSAAYRPQESTSTQIVEAMVRQARNTTSPVTGAPLNLSIVTGDNADNQQQNETRWFIDTLDGGKTIDPNSGIPAPGCEATPDTIYDGVRNSGELIGYYEPDLSRSSEDGDGYSPYRDVNAARTGKDVTVRDFPNLFERDNRPFKSVGLGMPWYSAFGNHDALIQGNSPDAYVGPFGPSGEAFSPTFQAIATGCLKPSRLPPAYAGDPEGFVDKYFSDPQSLLSATEPVVVPPDPRRCLLAKDSPGPGAPAPCGTGWIQQHFNTTGAPVGHGFANRPPEAIANHDGYYAFSPKPKLRFVVLDTITDECATPVCSEGSVDDTQFQWLKREISGAEAKGQYVVVFSHHTLRTTRWPTTDPTEQPVHYGQRIDRDNPANPQNVSPGETLEELFCNHPGVIAHVAGHEHENYVRHYKCAADDPPTAGTGDFWEISTAAHIDWPQQSRMLELVDNGNGTMSLVLTMLDQAGPANPGGPASGDEQGQASDQVLDIAATGREISYNDYQANRASRGDPADRNLIIVLRKPPPGTGLPLP